MIELKVIDGVSAKLKKIPAAVAEGVRDAERNIGIDLQREVTNALPHRSGGARRSIGFLLREAGLIPDLVVGAIIAPPPYMAQLEYGGVIRAKNAAHLTIPLDAVKTGAGQARFSARQVIASPQAFGFTGTFVNRGKTVIFGKQDGGEIVPLFALVTQVTQQATNGGRGWLRAPVGDYLARGDHRARIDAAVRRKLAEAA